MIAAPVSGNIANLQLMRALAALSVVVYHCVLIGQKYGIDTALSGRFESWGAAGVDVFFVISGFVMVLVQTRNMRSAPEFLRNRMIRIVPLYWSLTVLVFLVGIVLPASAFNSEIPGLRDIALSLARSLSFTSLYFHKVPAIYLGWTLEYEMAFYLVFALGIFLMPADRAFVVAAGMVVTLVLVGVLAPVALEFTMGMFLARLYLQERLPKRPLAAALAAICAVAIIIAAAPVAADSYWLRVVLWGIPAFVLVGASLMMRQIARGMLTLLGDASYAIYLVQVFTIPAVYKALGRLELPRWDAVFLGLAILVTAVSGLALHILFERPATRLANRFLPGKHSPRTQKGPAS